MMMPRFTTPVITSLVAGLLIALVVVMRVPPIMAAFVTSADANEELERAIDDLVVRHDESRETYKNRFIGRSLFAPPPQPEQPRDDTPPPPPRDPTPPPPEQPRDPAPVVPSAPEIYQGPSVRFVVGNEVWFNPIQADAKELRVRVGETREGVTVISTSPPWSVRVGFSGGEYDVELFGRMDENHFMAGNPTNTGVGLIDVPAPGSAAASAAAASRPAPRGGGDAEEQPTPPAAPPALAEGSADEPEEEKGPPAVPGSLTQEQIDAMSKSQVRKLMVEVNNAKSEAKDTDPALHEQLTKELGMLLDRLKRD